MKRAFLLLTALFMLVMGPAAHADVVFQENFDGSGPGFSAWSITDGEDEDSSWIKQTSFWNCSGGTGNCAAADSEYDWAAYDDKLSYSIDISGYTELTMTVNIGYLNSDWGEGYEAVGYILGYVDGNLISRTIDFFSGEYPEGDPQPYDLSFANGASALGLTFQFVTDGGGYFMIDDIEIAGNPVPVPAAVWLLGSGLIGLVGLRKMR